MPDYRDILFNMQVGENKIYYKQHKGWFVFFIKSVEQRNIESNLKIKKVIRNILKEEKELAVIDKWINSLKEKTKISVKSENLKFIEVD